MPLLWLKPLLVAIASIGAAKLLATQNKSRIDRFAMGIVRDIGRHKAKKRRHMNTKGLILTLMKKDDLNEEIRNILNPEDESDTNLPTYTRQELFEFGNGHDGNPILIGILGHVYDVSAGEKFYGEGGSYEAFAGHDVTYSLATGCKTEECVEMTVDAFSEKELGEAKRWLSFFHMHDKYPLVGKVESNFIDLLMDDLIEKGSSTGEKEPWHDGRESNQQEESRKSDNETAAAAS